MPTKKKGYICPQCQKKAQQKAKQQVEVKRLNHKINETEKRQSNIKRDKKGRIKDFDFDFDYSHSQSISFDF